VDSRGGHVCFSESVIVGGGSHSVAAATTLDGGRSSEHLPMTADTAAVHRRRPAHSNDIIRRLRARRLWDKHSKLTT